MLLVGVGGVLCCDRRVPVYEILLELVLLLFFKKSKFSNGFQAGLLSYFIYLLFFWPCHTARRILVPQPGIKPVPPAMEVWSPNHWTAREFPCRFTLKPPQFRIQLACFQKSAIFRRTERNGHRVNRKETKKRS